MAFDEALAARVRSALSDRDAVVEKKMFGGLAFLLNGNMCCGVSGDELMVRLDPAQTDEAVREPHVRLFEMTGRPMKGWLLVGPGGVATDDGLRAWVGRCVEFAGSLPAK